MTNPDFSDSFSKQQRNAIKIRLTNADIRIDKLKKIRHWILKNKSEIRKAIYNDFHKPLPEIDLTDIKPVLIEIDHTISNLKDWMEPTSVKKQLLLAGTKSYVIHEPAGVVLIVAPWNYPFDLCIRPLISAIAAGNCVFLKPSEYTPETASLIQKMVEELFTSDEITVTQGGAEVAEALLKLPFNHIFFTGSPEIGKKVMQAAAQNLSSVSLELGGLNPVILDKTADLNDAVEKIIFGKCLNAGQTCIAPNYIFIDKVLLPKFLEIFKKTFTKLYGNIDKLDTNPDYGRIINKMHFERISGLIDDAVANGGIIEFGGAKDELTNFIAPTLITKFSPKARFLSEEIFGPVLPIIVFERDHDVFTYLNNKPTPLALYLFTRSDKKIKHYINHIASGTVVVNDTNIQYIHINLPFGGKNNSGIGKTNGHAGFKAFSHERSVLKQRIGATTIKLIYPPYTMKVKKMISMIMKYL